MALRAIMRFSAGNVGPAGPPGPAGPTGAAGAPGAPGSQGLTGATGATGPQGPQGIQGAPGPIAPDGLNWQGQWSPTSQYNPNDVVNFGSPPASYWAITTPPVGVSPSAGGTNAFWAFLASAGPAGPVGGIGPVGPMGPAGPAGSPGADSTVPGPAGPMGAAGPAGVAGPTGPTGATGPAGPPGPGSVTSITAGTGLSGGTITTTGTIALGNTTVVPGNYTYSSITVNNQGQVTAASNGAAPPAPATVAPLMDGVAAVGSSLLYARQDHVHPTDTSIQAGAIVSDTAPASPKQGALWWDSVGGQLYVNYPPQWVIANSGGIPEAPNDANAYARHALGWVQALPLSGGTLQGPVIAAADPTQPLGLATKEYVDGAPWVNDIGRNVLHNGLFNILQRGAGPFNIAVGGTYTADRWEGAIGLSGDSYTVTGAAIADTGRAQIGDEAAEAQLQNNFTGSTAAGGYVQLLQRIEDVKRLSGKTVTVSFWANSPQSLRVGVGLSQYFGTGGSPSASVGVTQQIVTLTTAWAKYTLTFAMPSVAGKTFGTNVGTDFTQLSFTLSQVGAPVGQQAGAVNLWGMQLEVGSVATPLEKRDPELEYLLCARFYQSLNFVICQGYQPASATIYAGHLLPVKMRGTPTVTFGTITYNNATNMQLWTATSTMIGLSLLLSAAGYGWGYAIANVTADL